MDDTVRKISADDISPRYNWGRALPALGTMGVDFEEQVDYRRLHRIGSRAPGRRWRIPARRASGLRRQQYPLHHLDQDRRVGARQALPLGLLTRDGDPILWDFGSAAVHHKLYTPWLKPENCKAGLIELRGTVNPAFGLMERHAKEIAALIKEAGVHKMPVGVDIIEPPMLFELEKPD